MATRSRGPTVLPPVQSLAYQTSRTPSALTGRATTAQASRSAAAPDYGVSPQPTQPTPQRAPDGSRARPSPRSPPARGLCADRHHRLLIAATVPRRRDSFFKKAEIDKNYDIEKSQLGSGNFAVVKLATYKACHIRTDAARRTPDPHLMPGRLAPFAPLPPLQRPPAPSAPRHPARGGLPPTPRALLPGPGEERGSPQEGRQGCRQADRQG